jgi:hypothetical protein
MSSDDSGKILETLSNMIQKLEETDNPMSALEYKIMSNDLSEIFDYISSGNTSPSIQTAPAIEKQQTISQAEIINVQNLLNEHKDFVENNFEKADQYIKGIQLAGYIAFFAVLGLVREYIDPYWGVFSIVLMVISVIFFVGWEIYRSTLLILALKRHDNINKSGLEQFILKRSSPFVESRLTVSALVKNRANVWLLCVLSACLSLGILLIQLAGRLITF